MPLADSKSSADSIRYILNLLGKKRQASSTESVSSDLDITFATLLTMTESDTMIQEQHETVTTREQSRVQQSISAVHDAVLDSGDFPLLEVAKHQKFLEVALGSLPAQFTALDASQPWIMYWILNSMLLLGQTLTPAVAIAVREKVKRFIHPNGGIGGGYGQYGHVASTYASVLALVLTCNWDTLQEIKEGVYAWLLTLKQPDGSFVMHVGGESDTRSAYCVLVVASLLNVMTPELVEGTAAWIQSCQTYEGGFGGVPYDEAHGGYTYCAVAGLCLLGHPKTLSRYCNVENLARWVVARQYPVEGGLSGRTNKLVDGCYSHWIGSLAPILEVALDQESIINRPALQLYILNCCQSERGGLRDKPGKGADFYHTNYVLCGLATTQTRAIFAEDAYQEKVMDSAAYCFRSVRVSPEVMEVEPGNAVRALNPVFGIPEVMAEQCREALTQ